MIFLGKVWSPRTSPSWHCPDLCIHGSTMRAQGHPSQLVWGTPVLLTFPGASVRSITGGALLRRVPLHSCWGESFLLLVAGVQRSLSFPHSVSSPVNVPAQGLPSFTSHHSATLLAPSRMKQPYFRSSCNASKTLLGLKGDWEAGRVCGF